MQWGYHAFNTFIINARFEEVKEKRMFTNIVETQRCAVLIDGYYEWKVGVDGSFNKNKKVPYFIHNKEKGKMMVLAAIYYKTENPMFDVSDSEPEFKYNVVLMTQSSAPISLLKGIHTRMPVVLQGDNLRKWLDVNTYKFQDCQKLIEKQDL